MHNAAHTYESVSRVVQSELLEHFVYSTGPASLKQLSKSYQPAQSREVMFVLSVVAHLA